MGSSCWLRLNYDDGLLGWAGDFLPRLPARVCMNVTRGRHSGVHSQSFSYNTMYKAHILPAQSLVATNSLLI